jgi:hypothetical protein
MSKRQFPVMVNYPFEEALNRVARGRAKSFKSEVYPILFKFGLLNDEHVQKYLNCDTMEDIYKDALQENAQSVYALEQKFLVENLKNEKEREDVWGFLRDAKSEVKSPKENGFIFRRIPGSDYTYKDYVLKGISIKNLEFIIDEKAYTDIATVNPTDGQRECYEMMSEIFDTFNKWNAKRKKNFESFIAKENGLYVPNVRTILGLQWLRKKEKS